MAKLTQVLATSAYDKATATNEAGAPAFVRSPEERLIQVLTTGTFENTYYVGAKELADQAIELMQTFAKEDPKFLAQAILYARTEGYMRTVPITGLVVLSTASDKTYFHTIFNKVIQTPGDLADFVTIVRTHRIRGMGKTVTKAVQQWLAGISEYHVIKYGSENQAMSLKDMYRLARPTLTGDAAAIAAYVVKGTTPANLPQIEGYEAFKLAAKESPTAALRLVEKARLPWEVVTAHLSDKAAWEALLPNLPYMALLRNLNNLGKRGVLDSVKNATYVAEVLSNPDRIAKSKQLPFRYYSALKTVDLQENAGLIANALDTALDLSFVNMPHLGQNVFVSNDTSGSMGSPVSDHSSMSANEVAAVFAAAIVKRSEGADVVSFDTSLYHHTTHPTMSMAHLVKIISGQGGGGTDLSLPLRWVLDKHKVYETLIFLTDNVSWVDHLTRNRGIMDEIKAYRARSPKSTFFFVQLIPYGTAQVAQEVEGVHYIYGWSGEVLKHIGLTVGNSQVEHVKNLPLVA